jgi:hypothetical protein
VQHADGYIRCCFFVLIAAADIESDGADEVSLVGADSASWASEESVGDSKSARTPSSRLHLGELVGETEMGNAQSKTGARTIGRTYKTSALLFRTANLEIWQARYTWVFSVPCGIFAYTESVTGLDTNPLTFPSHCGLAVMVR